MEEDNDKTTIKKNVFHTLELVTQNITVLDLSNKNITTIDNNMLLPENLTELYLKHNQLREVPVVVTNLKKIKILDISCNEIEYFDSTPNFYECIEQLNISNNRLMSPPYWVWNKNCKNLVHFNVSCNKNFTNSLENDYFNELLEYKVLVTDVIINNCTIIKHLPLIGTFEKAKVIVLGRSEHTGFSNKMDQVPCSGLEKCCDIQVLDLSNMSLYYVLSNINMYKNLKEINLSLNKISSLPDEFCCLANLEICILSYNNLLYLPDSFHKLEKLRTLVVSGNSLCMLPGQLSSLPYLHTLDLYDNNLYEAPDEIEKLEEVDLAQNYFDEPENEEYVRKREKIRSKDPGRYDGRKVEKFEPETVRSLSSSLSDDDLVYNSRSEEEQDNENRPISSPEDWDSDEYWIPRYSPQLRAKPIETWNRFVERKMHEGNFCPVDAHPKSVAERVMKEKLCCPIEEYESEGQFEDNSSDDS